jgi:hypothetical protein
VNWLELQNSSGYKREDHCERSHLMCMKIWGDPKGREAIPIHHTTSDEHSRYQPPGALKTSDTLFYPRE